MPFIVVLVDNDHKTRNEARAFLQDKGYEVLMADIDNAARMVAASKPIAVVVDSDLGAVNAEGLVKEIKAHAPVIMRHNGVTEEVRDRLKHTGVEYFVSKIALLEALHAAISIYLPFNAQRKVLV